MAMPGNTLKKQIELYRTTSGVPETRPGSGALNDESRHNANRSDGKQSDLSVRFFVSEHVTVRCDFVFAYDVLDESGWHDFCHELVSSLLVRHRN